MREFILLALKGKTTPDFSLDNLKEEGRKVFNGLDMFIYQGQKSFYLWNKINPEIDDGLIELLNSKLK